MPGRIGAGRKWALAAVGVAAFAALAAVWWPAGKGLAPRVDRPPSSNTPSLDVVAAPPTDVGSEPGRDDADVDVPTVSLEEMWHICPTLWSGIGEKCTQALDDRYLREPVGLAQLHDDPIGWERSQPAAFGGIAWRDVFVDPEETREAVLVALSREECHVGEGDMRPDLGETCAADQIARLAMLHEACVMPLVLHSGFNPWRAAGQEPTWIGPSDAELDAYWAHWVDRLDADTSLSVEEYWDRRSEIDDARFRFGWRLMRCKAVPEASLAWLDDLPRPTGDPQNQHQGAHLTTMAARLGSEWAQREKEQAERISRENRERRRRALIEKLRDQE